MNKKTILVTGANRGIGFAVVKEFLELGHTVILSSRNETKGLEATAKLADIGDLHYHQLDIDDPKSVESMVEFVEFTFQRLDILINNAGINYDTWHTPSTADLEEVTQTIQTNLMGPWRLSNAFIPMMKKQNYGRIVNVSSGSGSIDEMESITPGYGISKAALNVLTIKLGKELTGSGILVNSVCPGWVRTDMGGKNATRSPKKGAETIIWLGLLESNGPTGKFFRDKAVIPF